MIQAITNMRWTLFLGVITGVLFGPVGGAGWGYVQSVYDDVRPVVRMSGEIVGRDGSSVLIKVTGEKLRDCRYLRISAFAKIDDRADDVYAKREDAPENGLTKPRGKYSAGVWRVWPVVDMTQIIEMYVQHDCSGRVVLTQIARVKV